MSNTIRLMTREAPLFDHAGLVLTRSWSEVDLDEIGDAGRQAIEKYAGGPTRDAHKRPLIMVHPLDYDLYDEVCAFNARQRGEKPKPKASKPPKANDDGGKKDGGEDKA